MDRIVPAIVLAVACAGCGLEPRSVTGDEPAPGKDAGIVLHDAGLDEGAPDGGGACRLSVTPQDLLTFGAVPVGSSRTLPVRLENRGDGDCLVTGAAFGPRTGAWFSLHEPAAMPLTVQPGWAATVDVSCAPAATGPAPLTGGSADVDGLNAVRIETTDPAQPADDDACGAPGWCVRLACTGVASHLAVQPLEVDFGGTPAGCSRRDLAVYLSNSGTAPLSITGLSAESNDSPPLFAITGAPQLPVAVAPGTNLLVTIAFYPRGEGPAAGRLVVTTDAANVAGGTVFVPLYGTGTPREGIKDVFKMTDRPTVDILVCMDVSQSMDGEQALLPANLVTLANTVSSEDIDYRLAAITSAYGAPVTCPGGAGSTPGVLFSRAGYPRIIANTPPDPAPPAFVPTGGDPAASFLANVLPGVCAPDGAEGCMEAIRLALTDPILSDPDANGGFLRRYAKLFIIAVTDGDDHSPDTVAAYTAFLQGVKGPRNKDLVSLSVVAPFTADSSPLVPATPAACVGAADSEAPGRYHELFNGIDRGIELSICSDGWGSKLPTIGFDTFEGIIEYYLSRQPDPATIVVRVNGVEVPDDPVYGYSFDPNSNSIVFGSQAVPPRGATVEVSYYAPCL